MRVHSIPGVRSTCIIKPYPKPMAGGCCLSPFTGASRLRDWEYPIGAGDGAAPSFSSPECSSFPEFQPVLTLLSLFFLSAFVRLEQPRNPSCTFFCIRFFSYLRMWKPTGFIAVLFETVCSALSPIEGFQSLLGGKHFHGFRIIRLT